MKKYLRLLLSSGAVIFFCCGVWASQTPLGTLTTKPVIVNLNPEKYSYRLIWFDSHQKKIWQVNRSHFFDGSTPEYIGENFYRNWCAPLSFPLSDIISTACIARNGHMDLSATHSKQDPEYLFYRARTNPSVCLPNIKQSFIKCLPDDSWWIAEIPKKYGSQKFEPCFSPPSQNAVFLQSVSVELLPSRPKMKPASSKFSLGAYKYFYVIYDETVDPVQFDLCTTDGKTGTPTQSDFPHLINQQFVELKSKLSKNTQLFVCNVSGNESQNKRLNLRIWGWN